MKSGGLGFGPKISAASEVDLNKTQSSVAPVPLGKPREGLQQD